MKYLIILLSFIFVFPAFAVEESIDTEENKVIPIGHYSGWRAFTTTENENKVCFMAASPLHSSPKREDAYLMISRRPANNELNVITIMTGVKYHKDSKPTLGVDNQKVIPLIITQDTDTAWIKDAKTEETMIDKMIDGNVIRTIGKSTRGTVLKDTYSLKGFTKALNAITKECPK